MPAPFTGAAAPCFFQPASLPSLQLYRNTTASLEPPACGKIGSYSSPALSAAALQKAFSIAIIYVCIANTQVYTATTYVYTAITYVCIATLHIYTGSIEPCTATTYVCTAFTNVYIAITYVYTATTYCCIAITLIYTAITLYCIGIT